LVLTAAIDPLSSFDWYDLSDSVGLEVIVADKSGFLGSATVGTKGQIVIPADARDAMQSKEGD